MDSESVTSGPLQQAVSVVGAGSIRLSSNLVIPGMKMEFPGPPPGFGHGFGPPTILDLSPRSVDHPPSIQSPYTPVTVDGESCGETEIRIKREVKTESPDFAAGDDEGGDENGDQVVDELEEMVKGCSRTMPRMPEASLLKWQQRRQKRREEQLQVIHEPGAMTVVDPSSHSPPADLQSVASIPKRKALIHPQRKHNSSTTAAASSAPIPVGIAVARQRRDKCRSDTPMPPVQPKARRATEQSSPVPYSSDRLCMSTPSAGSASEQLFSTPPLPGLGGGGNYPGGRTVYNPAALYGGHPASATAAANWAWSNPADYTSAAAHSLWPTTDMNSIMAYPSYPPTPPASSVSSPLLHHHHHHPASGPPFLLIPTACLDPYQRTMFWPGYATPAQSPWGLPPDMNATQPGPWSIHPPTRSAFELPILRADVAAYENPSNNVSKPECNQAPAVSPEIKEERISPEPSNDVAEKDDTSSTQPNSTGNPADSITTVVDQSIRVRDNLTTARSPKSVVLDESAVVQQQQEQRSSPIPSADYSGLQLLSDSIERFVSADHAKLAYEPEPIKTKEKDHHCSSDNPVSVEKSGNALDVLCAAALYQETDRATMEPKEMMSATSCIQRPTGFQMEFDFRSKLAELQRKYKEKQKELSSLKCKKKSDKKKKKRSSSDKGEKAARRPSSSSSSSRDGSHHSAAKLQQQEQSSEPGKIVSTSVDFIIPGRLELASSSSSAHRSAGVEGEKVELIPRIPTSYAAALASAATTVATTASASTTVPAEKKKRKPDFPVRKQDSELTETIVPSKKRKFFQLFQWCHSADTTVAKKSKKKSSTGQQRKSPTAIKPKMKPKLKAELQLKQLSSSSSGESEEELGEEEEQVPDEEEEETDRLERQCLPALQFLQLSDDSGAETDTIPPVSNEPPATATPIPPTPPPPVTEPVIEVPVLVEPSPEKSDPEPEERTKSPWLLTQDLLQDGLRVLISEEGLFHGGSVSGIRPPDIYGVVVDGERGSRPRILSTEELLHEALLEVRPLDLGQLQVGTRVCAYWSRKSRCLYPGVVSNIHPAIAQSTGHKNVTREDEIDVEFDDGDSGRIPVSQIRLLPSDYPVLERDPNPLLTLESRRHKRRISEPASMPALIPVATVKPSIHKEPAEADGPAKKNKKAEGEESKENNDGGNTQLKNGKKSKQHKKKHKKRKCEADASVEEEQDLIIPVSPGLPMDHAQEDAAQEDNEPIVKMETRGSKEAVNYSVSPSPRRAATKTPRSPEPTQPESQQQQQQQRKTSKSKMAAFLPERQLWQWLGGSFKKASKGKGRKEFYKAIHRGDEIIRVGDCAVFLSAGRSDRPYVGRIELLWQSWGGSMTVKVRWFYHPEETCGGRRLNHLKIPGALFESNHVDENDVQTISHCCTVSSLDDYRLLCRGKPDVNLNLDANNGSSYDQFYLAGFYDPTSGHLSFEQGVLEQHQ